MQMRPAAVAGISRIADQLPLIDLFTHPHDYAAAFQVVVFSHRPVVVLDNDVIGFGTEFFVEPAFVVRRFRCDHPPRTCRVDLGADGALKIDGIAGQPFVRHVAVEPLADPRRTAHGERQTVHRIAVYCGIASHHPPVARSERSFLSVIDHRHRQNQRGRIRRKFKNQRKFFRRFEVANLG